MILWSCFSNAWLYFVSVGVKERMADDGDRATSMMAALQMIQSKFQGAENYLKQQCGFSDEDIHIIRSNLVEKPSQI